MALLIGYFNGNGENSSFYNPELPQNAQILWTLTASPKDDGILYLSTYYFLSILGSILTTLDIKHWNALYF